MNASHSASPSPVSGPPAPARLSRKNLLWLLNGCLLGILLFSAWHYFTERQRMNAAARETEAACGRLLDKLDRRLSTATLLQEELRAELLRATVAAAAREMNTGRVRLALRRLKAQLEGAEQDLRQFAEETTRLAAHRKVRHGVSLLAEARQRDLEAQCGRLDGAWQELAALEQQADWLTLRWVQAVEQEGAAARQTQAQQLQEMEQERQRAAAELRRMEDALNRAHERAERAREVAWEQAVWGARRQDNEVVPPAAATTVVQVGTGWVPGPWGSSPVVRGTSGWVPPPPFPGPVPGVAVPYYSVPSYYDYDYGWWPRSRVVGYGVRHPRIVRIGPYLVVN